MLLVMVLVAGCSTTDTDKTTGSQSTDTAQTEKTDVSESTEVAKETSNEAPKVVLSLADSSDYYIGTMVGEKVKEAFFNAGADVQVMDAASDVVTQINQIQNAITAGTDIIYVFPTGDGATYYDVLNMAREAGVKTLVSNNYPGDGGADVYVGADEFQMGAMMAALLSKWVDETYPTAEPGSIDVLIVESTFNENMIRRCLGMRLVGEKFLREGDLSSIYFVKTDGAPVNYIDASGKEVAVDEPTGGLILDEKGNAQLNPYYNAKVNLVEYSNRNSAGTDSTEAQKAIENAVSMGYDGLKVVISYGDTGAAIETKMRELSQDGRLKTSIEDMAVFCSDLTDTNKDLILLSASNDSVLRGVMASGNLIQTLQDYAAAMVEGKELPAFNMEPLSFVTVNSDKTDIQQTLYTDSPQLPATELFFPKK